LQKVEHDQHLGLALVDQVVVAARAGFAPQRGDGVQQRAPRRSAAQAGKILKNKWIRVAVAKSCSSSRVGSI
jgi:hypothetical protein